MRSTAQKSRREAECAEPTNTPIIVRLKAIRSWHACFLFVPEANQNPNNHTHFCFQLFKSPKWATYIRRYLLLPKIPQSIPPGALSLSCYFSSIPVNLLDFSTETTLLFTTLTKKVSPLISKTWWVWELMFWINIWMFCVSCGRNQCDKRYLVWLKINGFVDTFIDWNIVWNKIQEDYC